jgi:hypothetical protein
MRRALLLVAWVAACGGSAASADWAGRWQSPPSVPGSFVEMTLSGSRTSVSGSGVQHVEAGADRTFVVQGTSAVVPGPGITFTYADGTTEGFSLAQPDPNHLVLSNPTRVLDFTRQ